MPKCRWKGLEYWSLVLWGAFDNLIRVVVTLLRDTDDDIILECALASGAIRPIKIPSLAVSNAAITEA